MNAGILLYFFIFVLGVLPLSKKAHALEIKEISVLRINSAITPATYDYLRHQFGQVPNQSLLVLKMNTPGGLVTTTKDIISLVGQQDRPVVVWIGPEGASASSAGAIIAASAHFIFMSPGTNMGAATPVGLGEDLKETDGRKKALNDLEAMVRSLSQLRGRPSAPFEEMIRAAKSFTDKEALKLGISNGTLTEPRQLQELLQGKKLTLKGKEETINFDDAPLIREYSPSSGQKMLEVLSDPSLAYFLFLIGVALIYFELQAPGGYIAGGAGTILLLVAAISFQVLPLDWGSLGLIVLGIVLLVLEVFIVSYGLLSLAGIIAFTMGSLFLFHGEAGFISIEYPVILSTLAGVLAASGILVWYLWREEKRRVKVANFFVPAGATGVVMTKTPQYYQVKVRGEIWKAMSKEELQVGDNVEVTAIDDQHLMITVKKY